MAQSKKDKNNNLLAGAVLVGIGIYLYSKRKRYVVTPGDLSDPEYDTQDIMQAPDQGDGILYFDSGEYYRRFTGTLSGTRNMQRRRLGITGLI